MMTELDTLKQKLIGFSFMVTPLLLIAGFAAHPNLMSLDVMTAGSDFAAEFRGNMVLEWGHIGVMLAGLLFMGIMIGLNRLLSPDMPRLGFVVLLTGFFGSFMLGVGKGAFVLTTSAFNTLPDAEFAQLMPGLQAMINYEGAMWLAQLYFFLPVALVLAGAGLIKSGAVPRWQALGLTIGAMMYFNPDIDLISLVASIVVAVALLPIGISFIVGASDRTLCTAD